MCTPSQKYSFLWYLAHKIIKQRKESSLIFISVLFWLRSTWFCPFTLEPNGTCGYKYQEDTEFDFSVRTITK